MDAETFSFSTEATQATEDRSSMLVLNKGLDLIMLLPNQNDPVAQRLTVFPSGKFRTWMGALFEVINVTETKHFW